jgi:hypothetical protein
MLRLAIEAGKPVLVAAMKDHGLKRPEGYRRKNGFYTV